MDTLVVLEPFKNKNEPLHWVAGVAAPVAHWIVDVAAPAIHWGLKAAHGASHEAATIFNVDQTMEQMEQTKRGLAEGRPLNAGYHAVAALLAAAGGAAKAVSLGASQAARFAPEAAEVVSDAIPGRPLKMAAIAWKVGGAEVSALRELREGNGAEARGDAVMGLGHMAASLGSMALGRSAALLAIAILPVSAPFVGIAVGMAFSLAADKALSCIGSKLKARRSKSEASMPVSNRGALASMKL